MKTPFFAALVLVTTLSVGPIFAMETDQYNLPPEPLADIGDEVTQFVQDNLWTAVARINAEIEQHEACLSGTHVPSTAFGTRPPSNVIVEKPERRNCASESAERARLDQLRSTDAVARAVYKLLGEGTIFVTYAGTWLNSHDFGRSPARFKAAYGDSIYMTMPVDYAFLSPTIRMDGKELGTDKFDHFFQQGYKYYKIYTGQLAKGKTPEEAAKKAISWGKTTEKTYFGYWVSGVYSNADLFANYAGMKFYLGLTQPVRVAGETRPPTLALVDGKWQIADVDNARDNLLKPFIADQMNEALNPSGYSFLVYPAVRDVVRKQACAQWRAAYPSLTQADFAERTRALELWNGEDYGFTRKNNMVTIAGTCFQD